jgi:hypothetical protein
VAQQRVLGRALPAEDSPAGRQLEEQARSAERYFRGDGGALAPTVDLIHPGPALAAEPVDPSDYARQVADELVNQGLAYRDGLGTLVFGPEPGSLAGPDPVQRLTTSAPIEAQRVESGAGFFKKLVADYKAEIDSVWGTSRAAGGQQTGGGSGLGIAKGEAPGLPASPPPLPGAATQSVAGELAAQLDEQHSTTAKVAKQAAEQAANSEDAAAEAAEAAAEAQFHATAGAAGWLPSSSPRPATPGATRVAGRNRETGAAFAGTAAAPAAERSIESFGDLKSILAGDFKANILDRWGADRIGAGQQSGGSVGLGLAAAGARPELAGALTPPGPAAVGAAGVPAAGEVVAGARPRIDADDVEYDDRKIDELTRRIYDRMRSRLRTELLIDRERAGLLTDLR